MIEQGTRFIGFSPRVDLSERKTANSNSETEPYTIDDIRGYKVFTALLTQSGGDNIVSTYNGGPSIIVGVTYTIADNGGNGWDFTNIGAPNNDIGTSFIATGTIPNNWGVDAQLDYNTGAPVATVLENTIGNIWFTYDSDGQYYVNSDALFISNKTALFGGSTYYADDTTLSFGFNFASNNLNTSSLLIQSIVINADTRTNDILKNAPIEIRVY